MPYFNAHNYVTTYLFDNVVLDLDSMLPVPGSISLDTDTACMLFDTTDQGMTIIIDCTRLWGM